MTNWEIALEKHAESTNERFEKVERRMDQMTCMIRNTEVQMGQITNAINPRHPRELTSKIEINLREHINDINLRSN